MYVCTSHGIPIVLAELQITNEYLMVDVGSIGAGTEEMNTVQVGDVDTSKETHTKQCDHLTEHKMTEDKIFNFMNAQLLPVSEIRNTDIHRLMLLHTFNRDTEFYIKLHHVPCVGCLAVRAILLHVHAKETHIHSLNLLKYKHGLCSVGELRWKITTKPVLHQHPRLKSLV